MPRPAPIYRDHDETYRADTCAPLVEAVGQGAVRLEALVHGHYPGRRLPKQSLAGIKTVGYWDAAEDQEWGLPWHRNEGIELTFLESGSVAFALEDKTFALQPDDLTVTRPWQRHRLGAPHIGVGRLHWLIIDVGVRRPNQSWKWPPWILLSPADLAELSDVLRHNERPVWRASDDVRRCFQAIGQAVECDRKGSSVSRLTVRINDLFLLLLDLLRRQKVRLDRTLSSSRRTVELFLEDLRAHPEHLQIEWSIEEMAQSCGLGVTQFVFHVKRLTNMTPLHYLNHCRLDLAAKLLAQRPDAPVLEVAMACGFGTSQYFATVFGQRYGSSPSEWRRREAAGRRAAS